MSKILVTGATGNVGRYVLADLLARGEPVRALVRDAERARSVLGGEVELTVGDYADRFTIEPALAGIDRLFLLSSTHPDMATWEQRVLAAAAASGVRRVVKMSTIGADPESEARFARWQALCEQRLQASGIPAVVLRSSNHMTNVLLAADTIRSAGKICSNAGPARIAMIDRRDLAAVAALTLSEDGHDGRTYTLTGPDAITFHDVAAELGKVLDRSVEYVEIPDEAAVQGALSAGAPEWLARGVAEVNRLLRGGLNSEPNDVVRVLLGREPYRFSDFAADVAPALRRVPSRT